MFDHHAPLVVCDKRQFQFRHPLAQTVDSHDPLFNRFIPVLQCHAACSNFPGQNPGSIVYGDIVGKLFFEHQITKALLRAGNYAARCPVVRHGGNVIEVVGKQFAQPFLFDRRGKIQYDAQVSLSAAGSPFHLAHL